MFCKIILSSYSYTAVIIKFSPFLCFVMNLVMQWVGINIRFIFQDVCVCQQSCWMCMEFVSGKLLHTNMYTFYSIARIFCSKVSFRFLCNIWCNCIVKSNSSYKFQMIYKVNFFKQKAKPFSRWTCTGLSIENVTLSMLQLTK